MICDKLFFSDKHDNVPGLHACYFLQCYPWDRYEWNEPSKNIKQELHEVEGELDL